MRRVVGRSDARATEPIERCAARGHVEPGVEGSHAPEVAPLLADLRARSPDDVIDVGGVDAIALHERLQNRGGEVLGMKVGISFLSKRIESKHPCL